METTGKLADASGTGDIGGKMARTVDDAASGAHRAIDKATDAVRPAVDRLAAGAHQTVDRIGGAAAQAAETVEYKSEQLRDAQARLTENCRTYVRDNPVTSLGIAVAAGFLLSRLLSSR